MARDEYINLDAEDRSLARVKSFTDPAQADPVTFFRGDVISKRLHLLRVNPQSEQGRPFVYETATPTTIKYACGDVNATPTGGTFTITDPSVPETTAAIAYNATAAAVESAIQAALMTNFAAANVEGNAGGPWTIDRGATGVFADDITASSASLVPSGSTVAVNNTQEGTSDLNEQWEITLTRATPVLQTAWSAGDNTATVTPTIKLAGSASTNKVYTVAWDSDCIAGCVYLAVTGDTATETVGPIPFNPTVEEIVDAFEAHTDIDSGGVSVQLNGSTNFDITFVGAGVKLSNTPTIAASANSLVRPTWWEADVAVSSHGTNSLLDGEETAEATHEIEIRFEAAKPQTFVSETCTFKADLIGNNPGQSTGDEHFLSRADGINFLPLVDSYIGGSSSSLDSVPTVGVATNTVWAFVHNPDGLRYYKLLAGNFAEDSPLIIRPDDYVNPGNAKVWLSVL